MSCYLDLAAVMSGAAAPPSELDFLEFAWRGVTVRAHGFLHGVTSGANRAYRDMVRRTVAAAPGLVLGEMGLARCGVGIRRELDDWLPLGFRGAARLGLAMSNPLVLLSIAATGARERLSVRDPFGAGRPRNLVDLCRSPSIHLLDPWQRRMLAGKPPPAEYLRVNLARRRGEGGPRGPRYPDPGWAWLTWIEPAADIPVRSVHMLEFAVETARREGATAVSLFVGETHQTDMAWIAAGGLASLSASDRAAAGRVAGAARRHAAAPAAARAAARAAFSLGVAVGGAPLLAGACLLASAASGFLA
jgi:hypothetical protein